MIKTVTHPQAVKLLHNKFIVVLGDSIQRSVYKDLVLLLQKDEYLTDAQLRRKGEETFVQDCLVEGGCLSPMHNGTEYREVRQFQSDHHLVRFYFVTRIYSSYMRSILNDFRCGLKPDVVIVNSCVWDISRFNSQWKDDYKENLHLFFDDLNRFLPKETLVIWNLTMPLAEKIKGGFLVPEIQHKSAQLRYDVVEANFFSGTLADGCGMDVLDLHFQFRFSLQHRAKDGVHWNSIAHRKITALLLQHVAQAWGVVLPYRLTSVEYNDEQQENGRRINNPGLCHVEAPVNIHHLPSNYFTDLRRAAFTEEPPKMRRNGWYMDQFYQSRDVLNLNQRKQQHYRPDYQTADYRPDYQTADYRPDYQTANYHPQRWRDTRNSFVYRPYPKQQPCTEQHHYLMKSRYNRHYYAPYSYHRPTTRHYSRNEHQNY